MKEILVLGSPCTRSTYYRDVVQEIVEEIGLDLKVVKLIDPDEIRTYGVQVGCSNAYCPGCNAVNRNTRGVQYTPALVIDGEVVLHSSFPSRERFKEVLSAEQ